MPSASTEARQRVIARLAPLWVFLLGAAVTAAFYAVVTSPSLRDTLAYRYFCGHPIEEWTTWLFFWGMTALVWKAFALVTQARVLSRPVLPIDASGPIRFGQIPRLRQALETVPAPWRSTWLVRRLAAALDYVNERKGAEGLEERLGVLSERDALELEGSYELVRTVTWAIPILGFLGTVVGITIAIANITPEQLDASLSEVVGGLAVAFDTTALALALSMAIVLVKFFVERAEQGVLARVDPVVEGLVLNRFEKQDPQTALFLGMVEGVANVVLESTRDAWREQGRLWTGAVEQVGEAQVAALQQAARDIVEHSAQVAHQSTLDQTYQFADVAKRLEAIGDSTAAVASGLGETARGLLREAQASAHENSVEQATRFAGFLAALEAWRQAEQKSHAETIAQLAAQRGELERQTELLAQLMADGGRVADLGHALRQNLAALADVQALDETIHSLSAAAHLLTIRLTRPGPIRVVSADPPAGAAA